MEEKPLRDLWCLNIATGVWSCIDGGSGEGEGEGEGGSGPCARSFHNLVAVGRVLYVFGGCSAAGRCNDLHSFDLETRTWSELASCPAAGRGGYCLAPGKGGTALYVEEKRGEKQHALCCVLCAVRCELYGVWYCVC